MPPQYKPSDQITAQGQTKSLNEWAQALGTPVQTILGRLHRGHTIEQAVTVPPSTTGGANKGIKADADILTPEEVDQILKAANNSQTATRDKAILVIAYRSGLRCSEILALKPKDIDQDKGTISVHHGKGDKARIVAMDAAAWSHIATWLDLRATWFPAEVVRGSQEPPLFCTRQGKPIASRQVRAMLSRRAKKAQIKKHVHAHGLRRTMASEMAAEGVPLIDISGALGHSNVATTDTYLKKVSPTSVLDAMRARNWNNRKPTNHIPSQTPPPDWLDRLKTDIGPRLKCFADTRQPDQDFQVVVLLF